MTADRRREILIQTAITLVGAAAFPRLAHRLRWPTRLPPRGFLLYIAFSTLMHFVLRGWAVPYLMRMAEEYEREKAELAKRLGREPTDAEFCEAVRLRRAG